MTGLSRVISAAAVALAAAAVWAPPLLVTTDGSSHVYNAMAADAVRAGNPPYASALLVNPPGVRPNRAAGLLLEWLGRAVGWELGERLVVTLIVAATFGLVVTLVDQRGSLPAVAAAWLSHNWFMWMGFYDFALSLPCFAALVLLLRRPPTAQRHLWLQAVLGLSYLTHLLTFAVGMGLAATVMAMEAAGRRASWRQLAALVPAAVMLSVALGTGVTGGQALTWENPGKALLGLLFGDVVRTFHPLDAIGGTPLITASIATGLYHLLGTRRRGLDPLDPAAAVGLALLLLSPLAPAALGVGSYLPLRLQMLGIIALLPAVGRATARLRFRDSQIAAAVLLLGFAVHTARAIRAAEAVARNLDVIDHLFVAAGAGPGAWVRTRIVNQRAGLFRISGYRHLVDRLAARRGFVVLDNYEALYGVFSIAWRRRPDWLALRPAPSGGLILQLVPGELRWASDLYLLHERTWPVAVVDTRLALGATATSASFAVAQLRRP